MCDREIREGLIHQVDIVSINVRADRKGWGTIYHQDDRAGWNRGSCTIRARGRFAAVRVSVIVPTAGRSRLESFLEGNALNVSFLLTLLDGMAASLLCPLHAVCLLPQHVIYDLSPVL